MFILTFEVTLEFKIYVFLNRYTYNHIYKKNNENGRTVKVYVTIHKKALLDRYLTFMYQLTQKRQ